MAHVIKSDGTVERVTPANGRAFTLAELQGLVGGYIELARSTNGRDWLIVNEEGKLPHLHLPINAYATFHHHRHDVLVGTVVVGTWEELGGGEKDE